VNDNPAPQIPLVRRLIYGMMLTPALHTVASLRVADELAKGPLDVETLAARCGAHPRSLNRLMRFLIGQGVFARLPDGSLTLNEAAEALRSDVPGSSRAMALYMGSAPTWQAWGELHSAVKSGGSAFTAAHGEEFFAYIGKHEDQAALFNNFMTELAALRAPTPLFDFSKFTTLVDVGGGQGLMLASILQANPDVRGILFDAAEVLAGADAVLSEYGVADRCQTVAGSFFDAVPRGGDAYILSNILHDWNDDDATRILRACRAAMEPGAVLVVVETIVEDDDSPSMAKTVDMQMFILGGTQRTQAELQALFDQTGFGPAEVDPRGVVTTVAV
jgi:hypothetical protein